MEMEGSHNEPYFRKLVAAETHRLQNQARSWEAFLRETPDVPDDIHGQICSVIGQAQLLINERFNQFSNLINSCEFHLGEKKTTCMDLQGFWEMIYFQVEDIDRKYARMEKLKSNGWKEEEIKKPKVLEQKRRHLQPKKTSSLSVQSGVRAHIMEARRKLAEVRVNKQTSTKDGRKMLEVEKSVEELLAEKLVPVITVKMPVPAAVSLDSFPAVKSTHEAALGDDEETSDKENVVFEVPGFFIVSSPRKKTCTNISKNCVLTPAKDYAVTPFRKTLLSRSSQDYSPLMRVTQIMKETVKRGRLVQEDIN